MFAYDNMDKKTRKIDKCLASLIKVYRTTPMLAIRKETLKLSILKLLLISNEGERKKSNRSAWVRPIFSIEQRILQGDSDNLIIMLENTDPCMFFNYLRMDVNTFEKLFLLMRPRIEKKKSVRLPISSKTRLQICLRYLASGDCMRSVGYAFRVSAGSVSNIVKEVCLEIWRCLKDVVMPKPTTQMWKQIAKDFEERWQFPNCIGAVDGKHVVIQAPPKSGSTFFNYKKTHSINLTAVADANYCFTMIDVGAEGRRSDAGVFAQSRIKQNLESKTLNVPSASPVGKHNLPYVLLGDEGYPLSSYLMRPYPKSSKLDLKKKVFNYRLSRARRMIESSFGILAARWRIYRKPINTNISTAEDIIFATTVLHNFIIKEELKKPVHERRYLNYSECIDANSSLGMFNQVCDEHALDSSRRPTELRELFADYFCNEGAVEWQWDKAVNNEF